MTRRTSEFGICYWELLQGSVLFFFNSCFVGNYSPFVVQFAFTPVSTMAYVRFTRGAIYA